MIRLTEKWIRNMEEPNGELLELDFYFSHCRSADALQMVVSYCCRNGGRFAGSVLLSHGAHIRSNAFTSIYSGEVFEIEVAFEELNRLLQSPDDRVLKVPVWSAVGITEVVPEIVTFCGVSPEAALTDSHPIAIVTKGGAFDAIDDYERAALVGRKCYNRFVSICDALGPTYASILCEESLLCRSDLKEGFVDCQFSDFFVSSSTYPPNVLDGLLKLFRSAYIERTNKGIYFSTFGPLNPAAVELSVRDRTHLSQQAARWLS